MCSSQQLPLSRSNFEIPLETTFSTLCREQKAYFYKPSSATRVRSRRERHAKKKTVEPHLAKVVHWLRLESMVATLILSAELTRALPFREQRNSVSSPIIFYTVTRSLCRKLPSAPWRFLLTCLRTLT